MESWQYLKGKHLKKKKKNSLKVFAVADYFAMMTTMTQRSFNILALMITDGINKVVFF